MRAACTAIGQDLHFWSTMHLVDSPVIVEKKVERRE